MSAGAIVGSSWSLERQEKLIFENECKKKCFSNFLQDKAHSRQELEIDEFQAHDILELEYGRLEPVGNKLEL